MGKTYTVNGSAVCQPCRETAVREKRESASFQAIPQTDPTLCGRCGKDGNVTLPVIAGFSVCPACEAVLRNYPFPLWVKASAAGLALLVVFSALWNMRFVQAHREMRATLQALYNDNGALADKLAHDAFQHAPESRDVEALAAFFDGMACLKKKQWTQALSKLQTADECLPENFGTQHMIYDARIGLAFDKKDYDAFLNLTSKASAQWPKDPGWKAALASAQACKYAATGNPLFREQALASLKQSQDLWGASAPSFLEYEQRIRYRLETREIIDREEFVRRFPNGWQKQKEAPL
jgi:hypothetical protein